ncbi:DUF692 family multinuclear iron-containing protein [Oceanobacillus sp. FSL W8-0428]|uniref:multinuclear nonheme iron-dependent oxidase n=1 Tax=Oceanobacillus sp. FSL W8-0428 TaxID=2921715 RepID=UPI0030F57E02
MKLAVNYSSEAYHLVNEGKIDVDVFKCPDLNDKLIETAQSFRPAYVHFNLDAGTGNMDKVDWIKIENFLWETETPYIKLHLTALSKDYPAFDINTNDPKEIEFIIKNVTDDINIVSERFGADRVIVENVIYRSYEGNMLKPIIDPNIITQIIEETKCGLLLDTAHAQMTCRYLNKDVFDYVSQLPLQNLKELHITGIQHDGNRYRDSMPMTRADWELAEWALENIHNGIWSAPWAVSFEYGGVGPAFEWRTESHVLAEQVPRLQRLVNRK